MSRYKPANKNVLSATLSSFVLMALYAVLLNMVGELLPSIMDEYGLSMSQGGLLQTTFNIGGAATLIGMLYFSDKVRKSKLVYYSFIITSVALAAAGVYTGSYVMLLIAFAVLGSSTKVFDVSVNAFVSDINTRGREFFLQLLHMSFGIGAVLGPAYASFMIMNDYGWKSALWFLAAVYAIVLLSSFFTMMKPSAIIEKDHKSINHKSLKILSLLKNPQVWILFAGAACFSGAYVGLVTWFPSYAERLPGSIGPLSGIILSSYFLGFVISRGIASFILTISNARFLIIMTSFIGGLAFITAFLIAQPWAFFVFLILAGFFAGATLPMIIFVACVSFPNNTGGVTTILYIGISITAMLVPYLMGVIGDIFGIEKAMPIVAYLMFIAAISSLLLKKFD